MTDSIRAYSPSYIKYKNRKLVFRMFLENEELSRAEIVRKTTMSFPTVMKVVDFLLQKNIIIECGDATTNEEGVGRKSKILRLNPNAYAAVGIEIEGKFVHIGLLNLKGDVIDAQTMNVESINELPNLRRLSQYIDEVRKKYSSIPILGIGIGFPGSVNPFNNSIVKYKYLVKEEKTFSSLFQSFTEQLDIPFFLQNDVNMASLGETFLRRTDDVNDLIYISLGTGLGAGIILDGEIRHGANFYAGEIGKVILGDVDLDEQKKLSTQTLESFINLDAINRIFKVDIRSGNNVSDKTKKEISNYICKQLCLIINNLAYILDIPEFVIGGIIPDYLGDVFYDSITEYVQKICDLEVKISPPLSKYNGIIGGAVTVFENVLLNMFEEE